MASKQSLSGIRILIVNDDGIHASGIKVLEKIAMSITPDVWIVAPDKEQSGRGSASTFDNILRIIEWSPRKFSVTGTPADNFYIAIDRILKDKKPDLVLSGINDGANVGAYLSLSGTLGAAFAAASQGLKSIAVSQDKDNGASPKFSTAEHYLPSIIKKLYPMEWKKQSVMNINFPKCPFADVSGIRITKQSSLGAEWFTMERKDGHGYPYYWLTSEHTTVCPAADNTDIDALCHHNAISITPLQMDMTDYDFTNKLEGLFYV